MKENKSGISENNINVYAKISDVRQPILVLMYKDILFITNQIHHQLSSFVVLNRLIIMTHFIQKISDMMHIMKENFSTKIFVFDPGGRLNIPTSEDGIDSRMNHFQEGGNDMILQQALQLLIEESWAKTSIPSKNSHHEQDPALINLIKTHES